MGRVRRVDVGEIVYHVLNRANFRSRLFKSDAHYEDFLALVEESLGLVPMRVLACCLMPSRRSSSAHGRFLSRTLIRPGWTGRSRRKRSRGSATRSKGAGRAVRRNGWQRR